MFTPLAVMDFTSEGDMRLLERPSGVPWTKLCRIPASARDAGGRSTNTPQPTDEEMRLMREFDLEACWL